MAQLATSQVVFEDGLGTRVLHKAPGSRNVVERLYLTPMLANQFEAILERTTRLAKLQHIRLARVLGAEREDSSTAFVESEHAEGIRLSRLLDMVTPLGLQLDIQAVLALLRELLPTIALLHDSRNVTHGAIAPERLVLTAKGRLIVCDHVLGSGIDRLRLSRSRLWKDLRIGTPPAAGVARLDKRADVGQIGLVALALIVGRGLRDEEYPNRLESLLDVASEALADGRRVPLSSRLRKWLERSLPIDSRRPFTSVKDCQAELEEVIAGERRYNPDPARVRKLVAIYEQHFRAHPEELVAPKDDVAAAPETPDERAPAIVSRRAAEGRATSSVDSARAARTAPVAPPAPAPARTPEQPVPVAERAAPVVQAVPQLIEAAPLVDVVQPVVETSPAAPPVTEVAPPVTKAVPPIAEVDATVAEVAAAAEAPTDDIVEMVVEAAPPLLAVSEPMPRGASSPSVHSEPPVPEAASADAEASQPVAAVHPVAEALHPVAEAAKPVTEAGQPVAKAPPPVVSASEVQTADDEGAASEEPPPVQLSAEPSWSLGSLSLSDADIDLAAALRSLTNDEAPTVEARQAESAQAPAPPEPPSTQPAQTWQIEELAPTCTDSLVRPDGPGWRARTDDLERALAHVPEPLARVRLVDAPSLPVPEPVFLRTTPEPIPEFERAVGGADARPAIAETADASEADHAGPATADTASRSIDAAAVADPPALTGVTPDDAAQTQDDDQARDAMPVTEPTDASSEVPSVDVRSVDVPSQPDTAPVIAVTDAPDVVPPVVEGAPVGVVSAPATEVTAPRIEPAVIAPPAPEPPAPEPRHARPEPAAVPLVGIEPAVAAPLDVVVAATAVVAPVAEGTNSAPERMPAEPAASSRPELVAEAPVDDEPTMAAAEPAPRPFLPWLRGRVRAALQRDDATEGGAPVEPPQAEGAAAATAAHETPPHGVGRPATPVEREPVAAEPVAVERVAPEPIAVEPVAVEPVVVEPVAVESVVVEPVVVAPVAVEPIAEAATAIFDQARPPVSVEPDTAAADHSAGAPALEAARDEVATEHERGSNDEPAVISSSRPDWKRVAIVAGLAAGLEVAVLGAVLWSVTRPDPGRVFVQTRPAGAIVQMGGRDVGTTPYAAAVAPGAYQVVLTHEGQSRTLTLEVTPGGQASEYVRWSAVRRRTRDGRGAAYIDTMPSGAEVSVDGVVHGVAPLVIEDLAAGRHTVQARGRRGTVKTDVIVRANQTIELEMPIYSGWLAVYAPFIVEIYERGRYLGSSEVERLLMAPGRHEIELVNERLGYRESFTVQVEPGHPGRVSVEAPTAPLEIHASAGTEVWLDGERLGVAPLAPLNARLGAREVTFRRPGAADVKRVVTVVRPGPTRVDEPQ